MKIQRALMYGAKKSKVFHLLLILGTFILLNDLIDPGSNADNAVKDPIAAVQSGVFVGKYDQEPVFTLGSKVFQTEDIPSNTDSLISFSYRISEGVPEKLIQAAINGQKKGLHLLIELNEDDIKNKDFSRMLEKISQYKLDFWISLIPQEKISQKEYERFYHKLWSHLAGKEINNITLVWYPDTSFIEHPEEENLDQIDGVGINISGSWDMAKLDKLYKVFADKKAIIINEHIIDNYAQDLPGGMAFLQEFYYALAVKYPAVTIVYQSSDLGRADIKYRNAMIDLKQKSWLTNNTLKTTNIPMFEALASDMVLTDQVEFLYRPKDGNYENIAYVEYKFNTVTNIQAMRPPFAIKVDTNMLHNGINYLTTVVYNKQLKIINKYQSYFAVENENIASRAKRIEKSYSKDQKPAYTGSYIPVLMYHDFASSVQNGRSSNTVAAALFEKQLKALLNHGYTPVTFYDLYQYLNKKAGLPLKPVIITTDDGYLSNYTIAYPLLKKYRIPATFFVTTGFMGVTTQSSHITWAQAREMEESGLIDIQSHTHMHELYNTLTEEEVVYGTSISFGLIEQYLGKRDVKVLSYPQFLNTVDCKKWIKGQGVDLQVTNLAKNKSVTTSQNVQRIHVHNKMSPNNLINNINKYTSPSH